MSPYAKLKTFGRLFACFGLFTSPVYAQINLIDNGNFGTATFVQNGPSIFNPSFSGWNATANSNFSNILKSQAVAYSCGQFGCTGRTAHNWACLSGTGEVSASTASIVGLTENTRYRLSYHAFKDVSGVPTTDTTYSQAEGASLVINSGTRGSYVVKDFSLSPYLFGNYRPGINSLQSIEFTTPSDLTNSNGEGNFGAPTLQFRWPSSGKGAMCLTGISLQQIADNLTPSRIVANTHGYPLTGNKIATLVLPQGTNTSGLKWRLRKGNGFPQVSYGVSIPFYAVVTGGDGLPVKDVNGNHILQKNPDNTDKIVGGAGAGGQYSYVPENSGLIPENALKLDADSGEYTYILDFSSYGKSTETTAVIDLKSTPRLYTTTGGVNYYIYTRPTNSTNFASCSDCYLDVVDSQGNTIASSPTINIQTSPYQSLKNDALYTFYHQRSGLAINPSFISPLGKNFENSAMKHDAGHTPDIAGCWANSTNNIDLHGNNWGNSVPDCYSYTKDVSGGWYDAADHGKYVVNGGVALWTMQNLIERLQTKGTLNTAFPAGNLKLPATLNDQATVIANLSDLLAEARTEMEWMLKMQAPAQLRMKVPLGYQDKTQTGTPVGPTGAQGVYQIDLTGTPLASSAAGAINFGGTGKLPRLRTKLNLTSVDVGGLVFHAVHDREWTGIPQDPSKDAQPRVLMYPTSAATLNFAAVAAQCSRIWKGVDDAFANRCFNAAKLAWDTAKNFRTGFTDSFGTTVPVKSDIFRYEYTNSSWASADPSTINKAILQYGFAINPLFNGGGAYGDLRVGDEFYWAGAELYLATAVRGAVDTSYITYGKAQGVLTGADANGQWSKCEQSKEPIQCYGWINGFDWQNTSALGTISLLTYNNGSLASPEAKTNLISFAKKLVDQTNSQGFKFAKQAYNAAIRDTHYEWGANGGVLNRALILGVAYSVEIDASQKQQYVDSIVASMGYLLGRNAMGKSFISGYGKNPLTNPHHRWFAKHADVAFPKVPVGYVAGGPNTRDIPALRANAPRYQTQADVDYARTHGDPNATLGGIADSSQRFFETAVVANCMNEAASPTYIPQNCYADHYKSFATNEVAINWQAPLVWVSQFLSEIY